MNEVKTSVAGIRKAINTQLKKENIIYKPSLLLCKVYCGEGFYINHKKKVNEIQSIYGNDKHAAYMSSLLNNEFPLSSELSYSKTSNLAIYHLQFTTIEYNYPDFYYTLYRNNISYERINNKMIMHLWITNIDYEIFNDLYKTDAEIIEKRYFINVGKLPLNDVVNKYYEYKKNDIAKNKWIYESAFYGMFAKNLYISDRQREQLEKETNLSKKIMGARKFAQYFNTMTDVGLLWYKEEDKKMAQRYLRNPQVPIAIFQTAYLRYIEWQQFKTHIDTVVYMNTDSIYCTQPTNNIVEDKLGGWKQEYNGELIFFIRRNAYIVIDEKFNIKKAILGGIIKDHGLTPEKLEQLRLGKAVKANTLDQDGSIKEIDLKPNFLTFNYKKF